MALASVIERHLYLAFALVPEPCRRYPFPVEEEFAFFSEADDIILLHAVQLEEHLVVIISPVHDKSGAAKDLLSSIAEKVTSLMEVKSFSFEEWIFEKRLTGWPLPVRAQASVT